MKKIKCLLLSPVLLFFAMHVFAFADSTILPGGITERAYLVSELTHIADPVLNALSINKLREKMSAEAAPGQEADRKNTLTSKPLAV